MGKKCHTGDDRKLGSFSENLGQEVGDPTVTRSQEPLLLQHQETEPFGALYMR